jgi:hypothetical protein
MTFENTSVPLVYFRQPQLTAARTLRGPSTGATLTLRGHGLHACLADATVARCRLGNVLTSVSWIDPYGRAISCDVPPMPSTWQPGEARTVSLALDGLTFVDAAHLGPFSYYPAPANATISPLFGGTEEEVEVAILAPDLVEAAQVFAEESAAPTNEDGASNFNESAAPPSQAPDADEGSLLRCRFGLAGNSPARLVLVPSADPLRPDRSRLEMRCRAPRCMRSECMGSVELTVALNGIDYTGFTPPVLFQYRNEFLVHVWGCHHTAGGPATASAGAAGAAGAGHACAGGAVVQRARDLSDLQTRLVARREAMLEELTQGAEPARRAAAAALEATLADRASRSWEIVQAQATAARAAARERTARVKYEAAAEALAAWEAEMTVLRALPIDGRSHLAMDTLDKRVYVLRSGLLRRYRFADAPGARIAGGRVTTQPEEAADALANAVWLEGIPVGAQADSLFLHRPTARLYWTAIAPGGGCKIERSFLDGRGCEVVLSSLLRGSRAVGAVVSAEGLVHAAYVSVRQPGNASLLMVAEEKSHATDANPLRVSVLTIRRGIAPSALMTFGPHLFYSVTASRAIYRCGLDGSECILIVRGDVGMASGAEVNGVLYSVSKLSAGNQVVCLMASDWPLITSKCH